MAYAAGDTLIRAIMQSWTGLPEDKIVHDFAFKLAADPATDPETYDANLTAAFGFIDDFYRADDGTGHFLGSYISRAVPRTVTHELAAYVIVAGDLGSPVRVDPWLGPVDAPDQYGYPEELSGVLSFKADYGGALEIVGATRPRARHRGRLFFGPLASGAIERGTIPYRLAEVSFLTTLRNCAVRMMDDSTAAGTPWGVWSRKDTVVRPVIGGWTDNAPDIQRRRGVGPTARTAWGA